jgi:hypothetical protein
VGSTAKVSLHSGMAANAATDHALNIRRIASPLARGTSHTFRNDDSGLHITNGYPNCFKSFHEKAGWCQGTLALFLSVNLFPFS